MFFFLTKNVRIAFLPVLCAGIYACASAQVTNSIPPSLFLTDDGHVFWHQKGKTIVALSRIEEARHAADSRPSDKDPDGHWGLATNGLQLSIRFQKPNYAVGEKLVATLLVRNVSEVPVTYPTMIVIDHPSPIGIVIQRGEKQLPLKNDNGLLNVVSATETSVYPRSQRKYEERIDSCFDLGQTGEYSVHAYLDLLIPGKNEKCRLVSQKATISVTNSP